MTDGYPTVMFINPSNDNNDNGSVTTRVHRGRRDIDTLMMFIGQQMGRTPAASQVSLHVIDYKTLLA